MILIIRHRNYTIWFGATIVRFQPAPIQHQCETFGCNAAEKNSIALPLLVLLSPELDPLHPLFNSTHSVPS